jgi:hypothetical protein
MELTFPAGRADSALPEVGIDAFVPKFDARERHSIEIHAPAAMVFEVACNFDIQSVPLVRGIFWLRSKLLGSLPMERTSTRLVQELSALGWGVLAFRPHRLMVMGAMTEPWEPNPTFRAIPAPDFASFSESEAVKIAWTIEAEPLGEASTRFTSETRAVATGETARRRFRRYWRFLGIGIVAIRWLVAPAIRREAERRYHATSGTNGTN